MAAKRLFVGAYACSGLAGLVYQVTWTRMLALHMGHSTAAASTVVAAFMGGIAIGSAWGGTVAARWRPRQALIAYAGLEAAVVLAALALPWVLGALVPLLAWAYGDGAPGPAFPIIRLVLCLAVVLVPALALGATFPMAVRWYVEGDGHLGRDGGVLYAANTTGAAAGALLAGFVLIPALGIQGTTLVGVAASVACIAAVAALAQSAASDREGAPALETAAVRKPAPARKPAPRRRRAAAEREVPRPREDFGLAALLLGLSGLATFIYEIAWTRVLSLVIGPTTYAFAATVTVLITGLALGSYGGAWIAGRSRRPALWLACSLAAAAIATIWATATVGSDLPRAVARELGRSPVLQGTLLTRHAPLVIALILPTALALGLAFPLSLDLAGGPGAPARRVGFVYGVNTLGAVAGALLAGFVAIPGLGLERTLHMVSLILLVAALAVAVRACRTNAERLVALGPVAAAVILLMTSPAWDRDLLASGVYLYAPRVPAGVDLETSLKAGTLLYQRDGAAATVSVKRLAGEISLSIDGKVDASSASDMPTQKALGHLPLLLHPRPRDVLVIGLGSGVTAASALVHPIERLDVLELSPEVVEASRYFAAENRNVLDDARTRLIVGDGRSHLLLARRKYDVIISEPSNPWMAGVASLFTREFFAAARQRLAPDGILCQWAHTYSISDADLRSVVATFLSVFPDGTMWLIGQSDVLLIGSDAPLDGRLDQLKDAWRRPGVAEDLEDVSALDAFALLSSFTGGPAELRRYAAGAAIQTDDRATLEFSGPRSLYSQVDRGNATTLRSLLAEQDRPPAVRRAFDEAGAAEWRNRGGMMLDGEDFDGAFQDYMKALALDATDPAALDGLVRTAVATHRETEALAWMKGAASTHRANPAVRIALSRLLAATGAFDEAVAVAGEAARLPGGEVRALEQLASIFADVGDGAQLVAAVRRLEQLQPDAASTYRYAASAQFMAGQFDEAARLAKGAADRDPGDAASQNLLGASLASRGQADGARQAFQAALRLNPRDDATYVNIGLLELRSGNAEVAAGYFAEALSLNPQSEAARRGLAEAR